MKNKYEYKEIDTGKIESDEEFLYILRNWELRAVSNTLNGHEKLYLRRKIIP